MTTDYRLDHVDVRILAELQRNGRITNVELADLVNLSPSPCLIRVKKLQQAGYITGYAAQINIAKLGPTLTVFTKFTLKNHRQIDFARFQEALAKIDSCIECNLVSGGYDYLVKFVTGSIADYQTMVENLIELEIGIDKYFSFVVMKTPFAKARVPLAGPSATRCELAPSQRRANSATSSGSCSRLVSQSGSSFGTDEIRSRE
jgi:DNA-binding Lrp family transcriptional regulator